MMDECDDNIIYETYIDEDDDNVIEESIEEYGGDYNYIEHIKDEDIAMEEEHLEEFEEDIKPEMTITRTVTVNPEQNVQRQYPSVVRGSSGQLMIVQSTTGGSPMQLIQQPQQVQLNRQRQPVQVIQRIVSPPQPPLPQPHRVVQTQPRYVVKQAGQQMYLTSPPTIKQEPEPSTTITRQLINRPGLTISRTTPDSSPTILNSLPQRKTFASPSMTVKQFRPSPSKPTTILNRGIGQISSPQKTQYIQRVVPKPITPRPSTSSGSIQAVNIPGKGMQYVRVLNSQAPSNVVTSKPTPAPGRLLYAPNTSTKKVLLPGKASNTYTLVSNAQQIKREPNMVAKPPQIIQRHIGQSVSSQPQKMIAVVKKEKDGKAPAARTTVLTTSQLSQLKGVSIIPGSNNKTKIVMLPSNYMEQLKALQMKQNMKRIVPKSSSVQLAIRRMKQEVQDDTGKKRRCNCTKSQCLKLYCDCFAAGEFCANCNCKDCLNDQENEHERQKAIRSCLERNPNAFKPKIKEAESYRLHLKGCNCKRSGCLKNYCECYEAKVTCSSQCKCIGCHNFDPAMAEEKEQAERELQKDKEKGVIERKRMASEPGQKAPPPKQPFNFMTPDVIEATVQCMIAQAEECQKRNIGNVASEKMILEEFGRCLVEIIDFSIKNEA